MKYPVWLRELSMFFVCGGLALVPGLSSANVVLDRLASPWVNSYDVAFGTAFLAQAFEFKEMVGNERKATFYGFTDRLGTLVDQRLRIEAPYVEMLGDYVSDSPILGNPVIRHTLTIKYLLDSVVGADDVTLTGGVVVNCSSPGCDAGSSPFHLKGYFRSGVPAGDVSAPLYGDGYLYDRFLLHFSSSVTDTLPGSSFSDDSHSTIDIKVGVYREYVPKPTVEYLRDALLKVQGYSSLSDKEKAVMAYQDIIGLRESDAATSSSNLNLRDAEYFLRGYAGGRTFHDGGINLADLHNELGNMGGPGAAVIYNVLKWGRNASGAPLNEGLPGAPPGGIGANGFGWGMGANGMSVEEVLVALETLPSIPDGLVQLSVDVASPTTAKVQIPVVIEGEILNVQLFEVDIADPLSTFWFDPQPTSSFGLTATGNRITYVRMAGDIGGDDIRIRFADWDLPFDPILST